MKPSTLGQIETNSLNLSTRRKRNLRSIPHASVSSPIDTIQIRDLAPGSFGEVHALGSPFAKFGYDSVLGLRVVRTSLVKSCRATGKVEGKKNERWNLHGLQNYTGFVGHFGVVVACVRCFSHGSKWEEGEEKSNDVGLEIHLKGCVMFCPWVG